MAHPNFPNHWTYDTALRLGCAINGCVHCADLGGEEEEKIGEVFWEIKKAGGSVIFPRLLYLR